MNTTTEQLEAHDERLREVLEPIGGERVRRGVYIVGARLYDLTVTDPAKVGLVLSDPTKGVPVDSD